MSSEANKIMNYETLKQGDGVNFPKKVAILRCHFTANVIYLISSTFNY